MKRIALLGCGAIGTRLAEFIDSNANAVLSHVYDADMDRTKLLASKLQHTPCIVENSHLLSMQPIDMVVEAASQDAVRDVGLSVLQNRKDLMIMSVGALLDESVFDVLTDACRDFGRTIYVPSGAIAGIDGLCAVREEIESISLTTRKHPRSLKGARFFDTSGIDPDLISEQTVLFEGTAGQAVSLFPANTNVAALLSLATIGSQRMRVRVIADPGTDKNTHLIEASGTFGSMRLEIQNVPDVSNPRTSRLAALSAIQKISHICAGGIQIG